MSLLTLSLEKEGGDGVIGTYCYIARYGNRIDCPTDDKNNVTGRFEDGGKKAELIIQSSYVSGVSTVLVVADKQGLSYSLQEAPADVTYFGPTNVYLSRNSDHGNCLASVSETKAFFHRGPHVLLKGASYVLRKDTVMLQEISEDREFIRAAYINREGIRTEGWLRCQDLSLCPSDMAASSSRAKCAASLPIVANDGRIHGRGISQSRFAMEQELQRKRATSTSTSVLSSTHSQPIRIGP
jgi:hypothetical protein